jgi:hypothetical protein
MTQTDLEESIVRKLAEQCVMEASVNTQRYRLGLSWQAWVVLLFGLVLTGLLLIPRQSATRIVQKPIEQFEIFDRVPGRNPQVTTEERAEFTEPDWQTTRIIHFEKLDDGGTHRFRLARSQEWIADNSVAVDSFVEIDLPEQGLTGLSRVVAVTPCPPPKPGSGALVTGVFEHEAASSLEVKFEGDDEPLKVTPQHPFWSEDRQDFVPIGEFRIGERARTRDGRVVPLTSVTPRAGPVKVHNLEIHGEHVFHAGKLSLLVHNNKADGATKFFRAMSEAEYQNLLKNGGLTRRAKGKSELGVSTQLEYARSFLTGEKGNGGYDRLVQFDMKPGAMNALKKAGAAHPSALGDFKLKGMVRFKSGMKNPQFKIEDGTLNILLGGSDESVNLFNQFIDGFKAVP